MKNLCLAILAMLIFANPAFAKNIPANCKAKAITAVARTTAPAGHDSDDIEILNCAYTNKGTEVHCDLSVSKGGGAALDSYLVILNQNCSRVLHTELTGEE